jgi:hypothetical protein
VSLNSWSRRKGGLLAGWTFLARRCQFSWLTYLVLPLLTAHPHGSISRMIAVEARGCREGD